jgi:hypothetical protein
VLPGPRCRKFRTSREAAVVLPPSEDCVEQYFVYNQWCERFVARTVLVVGFSAVLLVAGRGADSLQIPITGHPLLFRLKRSVTHCLPRRKMMAS